MLEISKRQNKHGRALSPQDDLLGGLFRLAARSQTAEITKVTRGGN